MLLALVHHILKIIPSINKMNKLRLTTLRKSHYLDTVNQSKIFIYEIILNANQ